jgi:phosphoribosylformimino-5-aminoimidazole carboxamide ribotide isomerase
MIKDVCERFPGKVLVGVDAKDGKVAIKGWEEITALSAIDFAKQMQDSGVSAIIYTDISRDGMLTGPNIEAMRQMVNVLEIPVIASGGISRLEDIKTLMQIRGLWGVITGKALYEGRVDLREAIRLVKRNA